ncbi:hypothetical protein [Trueperella pyogenes]|uniref:hypothetical protein n=1 Tax=Trueperella pyogenes TaxID=1661 RepID=UPI000B2FCF6C|nr:hypothetical protein [Trueperella pyogenes]UVJ58353.1 hypothetical protein M1F28_02975 [Trueperella pyogenes]
MAKIQYCPDRENQWVNLIRQFTAAAEVDKSTLLMCFGSAPRSVAMLSLPDRERYHG